MTRRKLAAEISTPGEDAEGDVWVEVEGRDGRTANLNLGQQDEGLAAAALDAAGLSEKAHA